MGGNQSHMVPGGGNEGYHVLSVQEGSPGHNAGLEAYFDFIIVVGNVRLNQNTETFKNILLMFLEKPIRMIVYNTKSHVCRENFIIPSRKWGGPGFLGVSIRFCSFENAQQNVWRILDVQANSPAFQAGLISQKDFIIGADTLLNESEDFFSLIKSSDGKNLKLFVYNCKVNACREVNLLPNSSWGGEGLLGCGIGVGYLHRIPTHCCSSEFSSLSEAPTILTHQKEVTPLLCHQDGFANPMNAAPSKAELNNVVPSLSLPAIITEINLPGLPPCNVAVPSLDLMGQACTSTVNSTTPLQFAVS